MVLFSDETKLPRTVYALCAKTVDMQTNKCRLIEGILSCVGSRHRPQDTPPFTRWEKNRSAQTLLFSVSDGTEIHDRYCIHIGQV